VKSFKELEHPGQIFYLDKLSDIQGDPPPILIFDCRRKTY
jgi:hypothetical protein